MGYLFAILAVIAWGLVHIPIKLARAPARVGVMVSMPVAMIPLVILAAATGVLAIPDASVRDWLFIFLVGLFQFALGEAVYYEAVHCAGITVAAPMTRLTPMLVVLATMVIRPSRFSWLLMPAAAAIVLGGILLARGVKHKSGHAPHVNLKKGIIFALFACVCWTAGNLSVAEVSSGVPRLLVTLFALGFGTVVYWTFMIVTGKLGKLRTLAAREILIYSAIGVMSYAIGFGLFFEAIRLLGVSRAAVIVGAWPGAAVIIGILVFHEPMNRLKAWGIVLLVLSAALAALA